MPPLPRARHAGATNRPDALDSALRRAGRFDREISLGIPSEAARAQILRVLSRRLRLDGEFDFAAIAKRTPGFVGADLTALTKEAAALAVKRIFRQLEAMDDAEAAAVAAAAAAGGMGVAAGLVGLEDDMEVATGTAAAGMEQSADVGGAGGDGLEAAGVGGEGEEVMRWGRPRWRPPLTPRELSDLHITMSDFEEAVKKVQPSVRREGFTTTPDVTWEDVGSLDDVSVEEKRGRGGPDFFL
jgi:ribosome biogenesis ATPase